MKYQNLFNQDFYPTPREVLDLMELDVNDKIILEPSAWEEFERGVWHNMEFFRYKGFKKGTMHLEFKDKNVWERLNRAYAQAKGNVLPEKL